MSLMVGRPHYIATKSQYYKMEPWVTLADRRQRVEASGSDLAIEVPPGAWLYVQYTVHPLLV